MLLGTTQKLENMLATYDEYVLSMGSARVSFEYLLVMTITPLFPFAVRGEGPKMLIATYSSGPLVGYDCNLRLNFGEVPFHSHVLQLLTVVFTSSAMCGQRNSLCMESSIRR